MIILRGLHHPVQQICVDIEEQIQLSTGEDWTCRRWNQKSVGMCEGILQQSSGECNRAEVKQNKTLDQWRKLEDDRCKESNKESIEVRPQWIKEQKRDDYRLQDTQVKCGVKRDEQEWFKELAKEAEQSMQQGNIKVVYSTNGPI